MKRAIYIYLIGLSFFTQSGLCQGLKIMPKAGFTYSNIALSDVLNNNIYYSNPKYISGYSFGATLEIGISDKLSIQPEVLYLQNGTKNSYKPLVGWRELKYLEFKQTHRYDNLNIPVSIKYKILGDDNLNLFVYAGPYFSYRFGGKVKYEEYDPFNVDSAIPDEGIVRTDKINFDGLNRIEIGANFGVGAEYPVGPGAIQLDIRYGRGFTNLYKKLYIEDMETEPSRKNAKSQIRAWGVFIGYNIALSR